MNIARKMRNPGLRPAPARIALTLLLASLAPLLTQAQAHDLAVLQNQSEPVKAIDLSGIRLWLQVRFSETELEGLQPGDLRVERYACGCYDTPDKHFPHLIVVLRTPRGDLVTRPEGREDSVSFTLLAVRYGNRYCEVASDDHCYGSFPEPCDFTDFRYGPYLAEFFPTCKSDDIEPVSMPTGGTDPRP